MDRTTKKLIWRKILAILDKSELAEESSHAKNTLWWVKKLKPDASMALEIAALAHDLERGIAPRCREKDFETHEEYKKAHSERSALILEKILRYYSLDEDLIAETIELVRLHEVGGSEEAEVLMDADSISFFDNNLDFYISYKGVAGAIKQVRYKFERCSPRAKKYIEGLGKYQSFRKKYCK